MVRPEYFRFMQTLNRPSVPEAVRKVANLVAANLDELVPMSVYHGQRIKRIVALAQENWRAISPQILQISVDQKEEVPKFAHLSRVAVGPFRGFARQENFDLASRLVLIYGPNGTGKSSFCEALEHGLLGRVVEAESKRFRDQTEYLQNAYVKQFSPPNIYAYDGQGNEMVLAHNEAAYRFCFVEKNRIDSFSRIAAQAPAKQTELISTLFGLDSFSDFVRNFSAEIGDQYIDTIGKKSSLLAQKRLGLSGALQQIARNTDELQAIVTEEQALATQYRVGASFGQMVLELNGSNENPGAIATLDAVIQQPIAAKSNLTTGTLQTLNNTITTTLQKLNGRQQELSSFSRQVSFKQLYEAVSQVQPSSPSACPACRTSLNQVAVNPYTHAGEELQKLHQLAEIQQDAALLEQSAKQSFFNLSQIINTCLQYYPQLNPLQPFATKNNGLPSTEWWNALHHKLHDGCTPWQHLVSHTQHLEEYDKEIDIAAQQRNAVLDELNRFREYARQITVLQTRRETASAAIISAQRSVDNFQNDNAQLIADAESESSVIIENRAITTAYATFVQMLNGYCNDLPAQLVANLGETVVILYNAFNRSDSRSELLANVKLPLAQNQRMSIAFLDRPNIYYDALHILSEGHIRCLGLAILLAKNLKENAPFLIFDDPVNAIDDDHRDSIRRTLFEDSYFSNKQILLTCHGEEFFKDIQNLLSAQAAKNIKSFSFLPSLGDQHIRVDFNCAPRNYILAARGHLNRNEIRDALAKSRQALESLTKGKVWRYVTKYGDGNLSLKLRSSSAPIELRNLAEQLKSRIEKADFSSPTKEVVAGPINTLLGLSGDSREWRYLNKGTHDETDRSEFDRSTVELIVSNLEGLDAALA